MTKLSTPTRYPLVQFEEVFQDITGGQPKLQQRLYKTSGRFAIVDQGVSLIGGFTDDDTLVAAVPPPAIIFGDHTKAVKWIDRPFVLGADGVKILNPCDRLDKRFAYHFLKSIRLPDDAGYSRHYKFLKRIKVPVPNSKREQVRIAAILDSAEAIRTKRQQALTEIDALLRATFLDMFGDPATNPKKLRTTPLAAFGQAVTGNTPSRAVAEYYGNAVEWIKSDNLGAPSYTLTPAAERLSPRGAEVGRLAPAGATLITCIAGSPDSIGNAGLADRTVAFNQQINALIPSDSTDPHFLFVQFLVGKKLIQRASTNSMKGMVSKSSFEAVHFLMPDASQQRAFGRLCRKIMSWQAKAAMAYRESDRLFSSLSRRAFQGEL
jgi:type I restriction enzyme S subunit